MNKHVELYSREEISRLRKKVKIGKILLLVVALLGLGVCVALCFLVKTATEDAYTLAAVLVSTAAGWICITLIFAVITEPAREAAHAETMLKDSREQVSGQVEITNQRVRIRNSVTIYKVKVLQPNGETAWVNVNETKRKQLKAAGKQLTLYTVHGFVAAYEERL